MFFVYDWGAQPGIRTEVDEIENQFSWGRRELSILFGAQIDGSARDSGSTPNIVIRPGLALGIITGTKYWRQYDPTQNDGTEVCRGFLAGPALRMQDINQNNQAKSCAVIVGGPIYASKLFGLDEQARAQCFGRFVFDDDLVGHRLPWIHTVAKSTNYTLLNSDNGSLFVVPNTASGSVTFTLPALTRGFWARFYNESNQTMTIQTAVSGTMVALNNYAASSIAFSSASNKIGAGVDIVCNELADHWLAIPLGTATATVSS